MVKVNAIVAMDPARVIGINNQLPWKLPEDLRRFAQLTTGHTVLMGRKTYQSLPNSFRPLPKRKNVVVSRGSASQLLLPKGVELVSSPGEYIERCKTGAEVLPSEVLWIIGGSELYVATKQYWDEVFVTLLSQTYSGDVHFPEFESEFRLIEEEKCPGFSFQRWARQSLQAPA